MSALSEIEGRGYAVLENVIEPELIDAILVALERVTEAERIGACSNDFEGRQTIRVYNLLARDDTFARIPVHPAVLSVVEQVLDDGCLVSTLSSIDIGPGETPQPIHTDDMVIGLPRPHQPIVCNTMWALTDFTEANGATRLVPHSHRWPELPDLQSEYESVAAEMRKGSVLVWNGSVWHGGGANRTDARRIGIAMNYCAGFIRQQENQQLGIPLEKVRGFPERLQRLVGYGVYRSLIGHIDKQDPRMLLGKEAQLRAIWDE
jgi:ectoine hydroxylase-related dioxygenase (phytanoyl-CoA dioxygenase family)